MNSNTARTARAGRGSTARAAYTLAPVLAAAMLGSAALGQPAHAAEWHGDSVVGGGFSSVGTYFSFDAASTADGAAPMGHASFNNDGTIRAGALTCLNVAGNAAVFGVKDTRPGGDPVYRQFLVIDHGTPVANGAGVDELRELGDGWSTDRACADPAGLAGYGYVIKSGDITVRDSGA
jgi:hypothetical protein